MWLESGSRVATAWHTVYQLMDNGDGPVSQDREPWLRPPRFPIAHGVLVHPDRFGQIHLPPPPGAPVRPEPVGEGLARVPWDGEGKLYQKGIFSLC